jgi:hypothetical protein
VTGTLARRRIELSELERAKAAVRQAERRYWRISHAYNRLHRERYSNDPLAEPSDAEVRARQAYDAAYSELSIACEQLSLLSLSHVDAKPKRRIPRHAPEASEERDE